MSDKYENIATVQIDKQLHAELKIAAIRNNMTLTEFVTMLLKKGLLTLTMLLIFVSCASNKNYVHVDEPNLKMYQHKQKIAPGMNQMQVMDMFGNPDDAKENYAVGRGTIDWVYYRKIFCNHDSDRCYVVFDNRGRVMYHVNFRKEFTSNLVFID